MKSLTISQLEKVKGGDWRSEALCGIGLGAAVGYSLSLCVVPIVGAAAVATTLISSGLIALWCHGWNY